MTTLGRSLLEHLSDAGLADMVSLGEFVEARALLTVTPDRFPIYMSGGRPIRRPSSLALLKPAALSR